MCSPICQFQQACFVNCYHRKAQPVGGFGRAELAFFAQWRAFAERDLGVVCGYVPNQLTYEHIIQNCQWQIRNTPKACVIGHKERAACLKGSGRMECIRGSQSRNAGTQARSFT